MWNIKYNEDLIKSLTKPFTHKYVISNISKSLSERENSPEYFIKRIEFQIKEVLKRNLQYSTPEEWDSSFRDLGGGSNMRTSKSILKRMDWSQFLYFVEEISRND